MSETTATTQSPRTPRAGGGRVYGGAFPEERTAQRRAQFLEAGLALFGTDGFRSTTVRALCGHAGLTDRYFYESFTDREALLMAVYAECTARLDAAVLASIARTNGAGAETVVRDALDAFFRVVEDDPRIARIVWLEVLGVSPQVDHLYNRQVLQFSARVAELTRRVVPGIVLPRTELDALCIALVGAISQSTMHWLLTGFVTPRKVLVNANTRLVLGLVATLDTAIPPRKPRRKSP